jgi:hypothetical protein
MEISVRSILMDTVLSAHMDVWISFAVGSVILAPVVLEFSKRNLPVLFGLIIFLWSVRVLSLESPEMQALWVQLQQIPALIQSVLQQFVASLFS